MIDIAVVLTTFPDPESARHAASTLVAERLAACAQVERSAIESHYPWKGELQAEAEHRVVIKTLPERVGALRERLGSLHPYELPQFVVVAASASEAYGNWVREHCAVRA